MADNERAIVGGNRPPSQIEFAAETVTALGDFLKDHPVIQTEDEARAGKLLIDRAKGSLDEIEAERDKKVRPLNEQVVDINTSYRGPRETLTKIKDILLERLSVFAKAERARREKEAEEKRLTLAAAERRARLAEQAEQDAREEAGLGVVVEIGAATQAADNAFNEYRSASREAARAEKATHVKLSGGFNRALSLRSKETLWLHDHQAAILAMGLSEDLIEAILKAARAYRKATGHLPQGITSTTEESL